MVLLGTPAQAQATRTWVSGVGSDLNPCSRTAPCKTFAAAYGNTAAGGEIDVLDGGGYGTLTIGKSLTIDGGAGQVGSVLASGTPAFTISGSGIVVTLRNITMQGTLSGTIGVNISNAARVSIENCNIQGFTNYAVNFSPTSAGSKLTITDSLLHDNAGYGIVMLPVSTGAAGFVTMDNDKIFHNGVGMYVGDNASATVTRTIISQNTGGGVTVATSTALGLLELDASSVSNNSGNGLFLSLSGGHPFVRLSNSDIFSNTGASMVIPVGGDVVSYGTNRINDNGTDTLPNASALQH
jgi:hypothetical protein